MLRAVRQIKIDGNVVADTPAVVPSFSSKGFPEVEKIVEVLSETITDCALISAYDVAHGYLKTIPQFPS